MGLVKAVPLQKPVELFLIDGRGLREFSHPSLQILFPLRELRVVDRGFSAAYGEQLLNASGICTARLLLFFLVIMSFVGSELPILLRGSASCIRLSRG